MRNLIIKISLLLIFIAAISGCASGPIFKSHPEPTSVQSLIYIYRPSSIIAGSQSPHIYVDGMEQKSTLDDGGYMAIYVTPGNHHIKAKGKNKILGWGYPDVSVAVSTNPQSTNYIRLSTSLTAIHSPTALDFGLSFTEVPSQQGEAEIKQCSLVQ